MDLGRILNMSNGIINISYEEFLDERIRLEKIDTITIAQKRKLVNQFEVFPYGKSITLDLDEVVKFEAEQNKTKNEYIHHFLTKYNKGKDWYSENYLHLVNDLVTNLSKYENRFLISRDGSNRICYVKNTHERSNKPYHVIACKVINDHEIIGWTHFDAKPNYINSLEKEEKIIIFERGLVTKDNKDFKIKDYEEYLDIKRKTPLYLGSGVLSKLHKS